MKHMTKKNNTQLVQTQYTLINTYFYNATPFRSEIYFTMCALQACHVYFSAALNYTK